MWGRCCLCSPRGPQPDSNPCSNSVIALGIYIANHVREPRGIFLQTCLVLILLAVGGPKPEVWDKGSLGRGRRQGACKFENGKLTWMRGCEGLWVSQHQRIRGLGLRCPWDCRWGGLEVLSLHCFWDSFSGASRAGSCFSGSPPPPPWHFVHFELLAGGAPQLLLHAASIFFDQNTISVPVVWWERYSSDAEFYFFFFLLYF